MVLTASDLTVAATGADDNFAYTGAGSGGLVAGSSAEAATTNTSTTTASVGASSSVTLSDTATGPTDGFILAADHTATFNSQIATFAGGLLAGTGGSIDNTVTAADSAIVGASAMVNAYNIGITATNTASKPSLPPAANSTAGLTPNIVGTTGGLISGAGATDTTTISFTTLVTVGSNAFVNAEGNQTDDPIFQLAAANVFNVHDDVSFETGGALGVGAELKNTFCLTKGHYAIVSQHIGDFENLETQQFFEETLRNLKSVYHAEPQVLAHDLHPDYLSTRWRSRSLCQRLQCSTITRISRPVSARTGSPATRLP